MGHIRRKYTTWKKTDATTNVTMPDTSESSDSNGNCLVLSSEKSTEAWIIYNVRYFHVDLHKEWFMSYKSSDFGKIIKDDVVSVHIIGIEISRSRLKMRLNMCSRMFKMC